MNKVDDIESTSDHPRKRSKISRACDCCRRKKVRCNAEYSTNLLKVTKVCTNCIKNNENCTFSRIPLKRGPSKSYIKDNDDESIKPSSDSLVPLNINTSNQSNSPSNSSTSNSLSMNSTNNNSVTTIIPNQPPMSSNQPLPFPKIASISKLNSSPFNKSPNPSTSSPNSSIPQIILPPIVGYPAKMHPQVQKLNDSSPSSPQSNSEIPKNTSPPISGPFWKVPYEMPNGSNNEHVVNGVNRRRSSSVDSVSSASTNGSRFPSLKPSISVNSDVISDSDDDFYSVKSHNRTGSFTNSRQTSSSPRNSVSSLSSLNGRMNKTLYIGNTIPSMVQQQFQPGLPQLGPGPNQLPPQQKIHQHFSHGPVQFTLSPTAVPMSNLENNLQIYYEHFHQSFPILPFNAKLLNFEDERLANLFNQALHNLVNFKQLNINDHISMLQQIVSLYPFSNGGITINDSTLLMFFSSFILVNYSILLNGDVYCLGISTLQSFFNQFKVLENFVDFVKETEKTKMNINQLDYDNIQLYLPKLYYCLIVLDNLYSICFGVQKVVPENELVVFLTNNLRYLIPHENQDKIENIYNNKIGIFNISIIFNKFITNRNQYLIDHTKCAYVSNEISKQISDITQSHLPRSSDLQPGQRQLVEFNKFFLQLIQEKLDLCKYIYEINESLKNFGQGDIDDIYETMMDNNIKLIRLIKKLTNTILNFANFIGNSSNKDTNCLINPVLNVSIGQLFKLIKLNKLIIDNLIIFINQSDGSQHGELLARCIKINNDLSISFNLLNLNLINLPLGMIATNLIKNKIVNYSFNFTIPEEFSAKEVNIKSSLNSWNFEFAKTILPFIERENVDGWY